MWVSTLGCQMTDRIPHGQYCYTVVTKDFLGLGHMRLRCPYWRPDEGTFETGTFDTGTCAYLNKRWTSGDTLRDQVKECGINTGDVE